MKKIIIKYLAIIFLTLVILVTYLSVVGIETNKLNYQIASLIKNFDSDLDVELKKVKLILDPIKFKVTAKTIGPKFIRLNKTIEIENLETKISLRSLIDNKFSLNNLIISTNSLKISDLISFVRSFKQMPELFLLEKIIKNGFLIADIKIEFDDKGKIKDNYIVKGFIKDIKLSLIDKYDIDKINLTFDYRKNNLLLNDIKLNLNDLNFLSDKITIKKVEKNFLVEGHISNKKSDFNKKNIEIFIKPFFSNLDIQKVLLSSKNFFSFKLNKKFKLMDLKIDSKMLVNDFSISNSFNSNKFFPKVTTNISFLDNELILKYEKDNLLIDGNGDILLQNKKDNISYSIKKNNKSIYFKTLLKMRDNPLKVEFLNFEKNRKVETLISLEGTALKKSGTTIKFFSLKEEENKIEVKNIKLNKKFQIIDIDKVTLNYVDKEKEINFLNLYKKNDKYLLKGSFFNASSVIEHLINGKSTTASIVDIDTKIEVIIDKIRLDNNHDLEDFNGNLSLQGQKIKKANLTGNFSKNKKLKFTVNSNNNNKITTLFLDKAEPIVKRYKFIKGFENGSLDFYSSKVAGKSNSTLKIYDFKLKELPVLTKILTLASLKGIADLLSGDGITFNEFEMNFRNDNNGMVIDEIYAIGPAISILMDGYLQNNKLISLRGTLVPATTINKAIGSIPILGKILVGTKTGEGVFGVSFKIKGPPKNPKTTVNPIKTLTPRFITRTLEKIKKN